MPELVRIKIDGRNHDVPLHTTVAAALLNLGSVFRISVSGEARGPLCGMGTCYECRVTIDGQQQVRSCTVLCADGMEVTTDV